MEGLTPGEKIKKLRLDLGLKQDDLTNEEVSKCLISMIERNKRGLTWSVAKIVADSFNQYYKSMNKEITPEFLMETEIERVKKEFNEEVQYIQTLLKAGKIDTKLMTPIFDKLLGLVNQWKLRKEKAEVLLLRGEFYYSTYQYNNSIKDLTEALEYYIEEKNYYLVAYIYNYMGGNYQLLMSIDQAINYYTKAYDITLEHNTDNKERIRLQTTKNLVVCFRKMKRYDIAIQYINGFKDAKWKDLILYQRFNSEIMLLEANTYRDMTNYVRAEQVYKKLLEIKDELDKDVLFLTYDNYAILLLEMGKVDSAVKKVSKAYELMDKVLPYFRLGLIFTKSKCHIKSGRLSKLFETLKEGIDLAEEVNNIEMFINFNFAYAQMYISLKNYENALKHIKTVEKYVIQNNIKTKEYDLNIFLAEVYYKAGETDKGLEYMLKNRKDYFDLQNLK